MVKDSATGITTKYYYDLINRLATYKQSGGGVTHIAEYSYDVHNNLKGLFDTINGSVNRTYYGYDDENRSTSIKDGNIQQTNSYDGFSRTDTTVLKNGSTTVLTNTFDYRNIGDEKTTRQVSSISTVGSGYNVAYTYEYDSNGNITSVDDGTNETRYTYDSANQLIREDNEAAGFTHVWTYDVAGNIVKREEYTYTTADIPGNAATTVNYTYGNADWGDLLTGYGNQTISYDGIGNPETIGSRTFSWDRGRRLSALTDGSITWEFTYNTDGLRTKRTNGTKTYTYVYNGDSLRYLDIDGTKLYFILDASGSPIALTRQAAGSTNKATFFFTKNLQGDITGIVNTAGVAVVTYIYDAWGKLLDITGSMKNSLGVENPYRYRGYVYDTETELYYLQSRYYDPEMGRFINADAFTATGQGLLGNNMFAYCGNNPAARADSSGNFFFTVLGAAIGGITGYLDAKLMGTDTETGFKSGFVSGAIAGAGVDIGVLVTAGTGGTGVSAGLAIAGAFGAIGSAVGTGISSNWTANGIDYLGAAFVGAGMNMISFGLAPINGEIPKAPVKYMTDMLMYEGQRCLTENIITGTAVAVATTWIIRAGSTPGASNKKVLTTNMLY